MSQPSAEPVLPADPEAAAYAAALAQGRLLVKRCRACGEHHHYPRAGCPFCFSVETEWREARGEGQVYAFSALHTKAGRGPVLAYVTLDEGPTMMTSIVDIPFEDIAIGRRVRFVVRPGVDGEPAAMFTPA